MRRIAATVMAALIAVPSTAWAHGEGLAVGPVDVWHHWSFDPLVWAPLIVAHWLYGRGVLRLWARAGSGRIIPLWRVSCFLAGEALLAAALLSPLDALGETLLSAHMTQHLLLTGAAPALVLLGEPMTAWLWALPRSWRALARARVVRWLRRSIEAASRPLTATVLYGVILWFWHIPVFFNAALRDTAIHQIEHASFLASGLVFWQAMRARAVSPFAAAMLILLTFVHMGALAAIMVVAPTPLYAYGDRALLWSLQPLEDQQIAGLIMWAPAGLFYLLAFAAVARRLFPAVAPAPARVSHGIIRARTSSRSMK